MLGHKKSLGNSMMGHKLAMGSAMMGQKLPFNEIPTAKKVEEALQRKVSGGLERKR